MSFKFEEIIEYFDQFDELSEEMLEWLVDEAPEINVEEQDYLPDASVSVFINDNGNYLVWIRQSGYYYFYLVDKSNIEHECVERWGIVVQFENESLATVSYLN